MLENVRRNERRKLESLSTISSLLDPMGIGGISLPPEYANVTASNVIAGVTTSVWTKVHQAGCVFYVHSVTGLCSEDDPRKVWGQGEGTLRFDEIATARNRVPDGFGKEGREKGEELATGCGAYGGELRTEFLQVFDFLEGRRKSPL